jgi:hypothetical protein
MTQAEGTKKKTGCWGCLAALAFILAVPLSLLVSLGSAVDAQKPVSTLDTTTDGVLVTIWGMAAFAVVVTLAGIISRIRARPVTSRLGRPLGGGLAAILVVAMTIGAAGYASNVVNSNGPHNDRVRQAFTASVPACKGGAPVVGAATYVGSDHPFVVVYAPDASPGGTQAEVAAKAAALGPLPDAVSAVQLVICIETDREVTIQVCDYTLGDTYTRYGHERDVSVYAARSGQLLERKTFSGSRPDACPQYKSANQNDTHGGNIGWDDTHIWGYIGAWLSGPMPSASPTDNP